MKYYNSINKIPLSNFVDCYVDQSLESLIIEGDVSRETLESAWQDIQGEFANAMGNNEQRMYLGVLKEVNNLSCTINQANSLIDIMENAYNRLLGVELNKILIANIHWIETDNRELINGHLKRCRSMVKPLEMKYDIKKFTLEQIEKKLLSGQTAKPTRGYFDLLLNLLEEHYSVPCDYNILTSRFCDKIKRMDDTLKKRKFK